MRLWLILVLFGTLISCNEDESATMEIPSDVMPRDSMSYHLARLHVIDATARHKDVRKQNLLPFAQNGYIVYFDTGGVSRKRFTRSLTYWVEEAKMMTEVYDDAMAILSTKHAALENKEKSEELTTPKK